MKRTSGIALTIALGLSALSALAQEEAQQPRQSREPDPRVERQDAAPAGRGERRVQPPEAQRIQPGRNRERDGERSEIGPRVSPAREPRIVTPRPRPESDRPTSPESRDRGADRSPREPRPRLDGGGPDPGLRPGQEGPRPEARRPAPPEDRDRPPARGEGPQDFNLRGPGPGMRPQFQSSELSNLRRELSLLREDVQRLERLLLQSRGERPEFPGRSPGVAGRGQVRPRNPMEPRGEFRPGSRQPDQFGNQQGPPQRRGQAFERGDGGQQRSTPSRDRERQPDRPERE
jgi:hypothetical protein